CNSRFEAPVDCARRRACQTWGPFPRRFRPRGRCLHVSPHRVKAELFEGAQSLPGAHGRSPGAPAGVLPVQAVTRLLDADVLSQPAKRHLSLVTRPSILLTYSLLSLLLL